MPELKKPYSEETIQRVEIEDILATFDTISDMATKAATKRICGNQKPSPEKQAIILQCADFAKGYIAYRFYPGSEEEDNKFRANLGVIIGEIKENLGLKVGEEVVRNIVKIVDDGLDKALGVQTSREHA